MRIFNETKPNLLNFTANIRNAMLKRIESETPNYILQVNETIYVEFLTQTYQVKSLEIDFDGTSLTSSEQMIEAERFGFDFNVYPGKQYPKQVITYHIPYSGNSDLLNFRPGQYYDPMPEVSLHEKSIDFDVVNFYDDPEKVRQQADGYIVLNLLCNTCEKARHSREGGNPSFARLCGWRKYSASAGFPPSRE